MLKRIDRPLIQVIFFMLIATLLLFVILMQFFGKSDFSNIILTIYLVLTLQFFVLFILLFKNLLEKNVRKIIAYLLTTIISGFLLFMSYLPVFALNFGTTIGDENIKNFTKSKLCDEINTDIIKSNVENISKRKFASDMNKDFIERTINENKELPKRIKEITCGSRKTNTSIVVFRIWDINGETYELEMEKQNGKWNYISISPTTFFEE